MAWKKPEKPSTSRSAVEICSNCCAGTVSCARKMRNSWRNRVFVALAFLLLTATMLMLDQVFDGGTLKFFKCTARLQNKNLLMRHRSESSRIVEGKPQVVAHRLGSLAVRDIVAFPDNVLLLVQTVDRSVNITTTIIKDNLQCLFGKKKATRVLTIEHGKDVGTQSLLYVRCERPPQDPVEPQEVTLLFNDSNFVLRSTAEFITNSSWRLLVYESLADVDSILLFAKGLVDRRGRPNNYSASLDKLSCRFGRGPNYISTRVKLIAQEVVRCELPPPHAVQNLRGAPISLFVPKIGLLPSVAVFDFLPDAKATSSRHGPREGKKSHKTTSTRHRPREEKKFHICACTMIWNQAKFLREWVMYHAFLGIERWYLYDNNSDDEIAEMVALLQRESYNVTRVPWPWIKTQEAGFSHCALRAKPDCKWVLFADVDEFVYPKKDLESFVAVTSTPSGGRRLTRESVLELHYHESKLKEQALAKISSNGTSVLRRLIERTVKRGVTVGKKVGEVRLLCHNFGPSGLVHTPQAGVMMGYTCRMRWPQRYKSILFLEALSDSLMNVVHHFALQPGYDEMAVPARVAVINHYKFQVWEEFKSKFIRRVATYVVNWREQAAITSKDRTPGLGLEAVEPSDWPSRYCEEEDLALRDFVWNAFVDPRTRSTPWQLM